MFGGSGRGSSSGARTGPGILQDGVALAPAGTSVRASAQQRPFGEYEDVEDPVLRTIAHEH